MDGRDLVKEMERDSELCVEPSNLYKYIRICNLITNYLTNPNLVLNTKL